MQIPDEDGIFLVRLPPVGSNSRLLTLLTGLL